MKQKQKGFTLIELIVVMAIIAILVLIAAPKFMGYTEKAKLTQVINDIKVSEKAAEQYYLRHDLWPRDQTATPYTLTQLNTWVDDFRNLSGETVTLEPGDYYDVEWSKLQEFMNKPDNNFKYIIQNPVGDIYYVNDLTPAGEQTKFAGDNQVTTEPVVEVESITITAPNTSINVGETLQITSTILPENANDKKIIWTSDNELVATVSENGLILGISSGNVAISGTINGITKTLNIIVNPLYSGMKVSTGTLGYHSFVIDDIGDVWAFGYNPYGQLGLGDTVNRNTPQKVNITGVKSISVGVYHTIALKTNGEIWSWGYNLHGQLGLGDNTNKHTPQKVNITGVESISTGYFHSTVLKTNGEVWSWGQNSNGQLGLGNTSNQNTPQKTNIDNVKIISSGESHVVAIKTNGEVFVWGNSIYGQLGLGNVPIQTTPQKINITDIKDISAGANHTVALKTNGDVWGWGYNMYGQLGLGNNTQQLFPQQSSITGVKSISAGTYNTFAIKTNGELWTWGRSSYGQLGLGDNLDYFVPQKVNITDIESISGLYHHTLAVKTNGDIYAWGYNGEGQLGLGNNTNKNTPQKLTFFQ